MNDVKRREPRPERRLAQRFSIDCRRAAVLGGGASWLLLGLALVAPGHVEAGSVFMKNGYIIQGEIVDRDDVNIVLGWPNGKVTIARRFVESIAFDMGEEQKLRELETLRAEIQGRASVEDMAMFSGMNETADLPPTLEVFMQKYDVGPDPTPAEVPEVVAPFDTVDGEDAVVAAGEENPLTVSAADAELVSDATSSGGADTGSDSETTVEVVPAPDAPSSLGDRIDDADRSISLRPPEGWSVVRHDDALELAGEVDAEGFRPSLSVVTVPVGALRPAEYEDLLKDSQERMLEGLVVLEERRRTIGPASALEVIVEGAYKGRRAVLRQCLVVRDDAVWLLSGFARDRESDGAFALIDESLATVEFIAE